MLIYNQVDPKPQYVKYQQVSEFPSQSNELASE